MICTSGIVCDDGRAAQRSVLPSSSPIPSFSYSNYPVIDYASIIQRYPSHFVRFNIEEHPKNLRSQHLQKNALSFLLKRRRSISVHTSVPMRFRLSTLPDIRTFENDRIAR